MIVIAALFANASAQALDCKDPFGTTQINECADRRFRSADLALKTQWAEALSRVKAKHPAQVATLAASQREWTRYRDAQCQAEAGILESGNHPELVAADCKAVLTKLRTAQLKTIAEGD